MNANDTVVYVGNDYEVSLSPEGVLKIFSFKELQIEPVAANAMWIRQKPLHSS